MCRSSWRRTGPSVSLVCLRVFCLVWYCTVCWNKHAFQTQSLLTHCATQTYSAKVPGLLLAIQKHRVGLAAKSSSSTSKELVAAPRKRGCGRFEQFRLLFKRSWRQITRSKGANIARAGACVRVSVCVCVRVCPGYSWMIHEAHNPR